VIDAAGISKGSMYYAFDGKEDLYLHEPASSSSASSPASGPSRFRPKPIRHRLVDVGVLLPERTELAWRRTNLAVIIGALVALRLPPPILGSWSISVGLVGLVMAV
jgi:hypothetical protein